MNEKALKTLEYDKIIEKLADYASSPGGKARCLSLRPMQDMSGIRTAQKETGDALSRLYRQGSVSFSGTRDIRASLKRLEIGSSLNSTELLQVCGLLETAGRAKQYARRCDGEQEQEDSLDPLFSAREPCPPLSS